ncbi:hypothetical protein SAMN05421812_103233 [Asanoa hainanensis]|uniref:Uncharacterized protein n=1 Tax=Asanoa hainanensis TaxID=560556 RepID=A0A239K0S3_9ACTN|nr:hypothetical protein [Asanoa hainanensis]SNT11615.1 hypothetical protein SAMN05421812_103233 [Asanoa hainanensis]
MDIGKETHEYEFAPLHSDPFVAPGEPAIPAPVEPAPVKEPATT